MAGELHYTAGEALGAQACEAGVLYPLDVEVGSFDSGIAVTWQDGTAAHIPYLWLRHNCDCDECVVRQTGEKRLLISAVDADLKPWQVSVEGVANDAALAIEWPGGHRTLYPVRDLRQLLNPPRRPLRHWHGTFQPRSFAFYDFLQDDRTAAAFIAEFLATGACLLVDGPTEPNSLEALAPRLGPVREVLFERIHNVEVNPWGYNIAHTAEDVPPHNDMVSYAWPPSVQALHMLANDCEGGESGIVDGFAVLERLRLEQPAMFDVLRTVPVPFRQFDADNETHAFGTTVEVDGNGELRLLRFSNQLMQRVPLYEPRLFEFYAAYQELARRMLDPGARARFRLEAGEVLIIAAHRVLHARYPITSVGRRHLQDAYFDHDNVRNHLTLLRRQGRIEADDGGTGSWETARIG